MRTSDQVVEVRGSDGDRFVVPLAVVNRHRAERCARHDAEAGLLSYDVALVTELSYGRVHPESLRSWVRERMSWPELEPHARLVRESLRG